MIDGNPALLVPYFTWQDSAYSLTTGTVQVLTNNPQRVGIIFNLMVTNNAYVSPSSAVSRTNGIALSQNYPTLEIKFRDYGGLVTEAWYAVGAGINTTLYVVEIIYKPTGD